MDKKPDAIKLEFDEHDMTEVYFDSDDEETGGEFACIGYDRCPKSLGGHVFLTSCGITYCVHCAKVVA